MSYRVPVLETFAWQKPVLDLVNTPPATPAKADRYIVGNSPSNDFSGHANEIAWHDGSAWQFDVPQEGWTMYNVALGEYIKFDGSTWFEQNVTSNIIHVDNNRTDSYTESGSSARPFKSIAGATNIATAGQLIQVNPGTYNEDVSLPDGCSIKGAGSAVTSINGNLMTGSTHLSVLGITIQNIFTVGTNVDNVCHIDDVETTKLAVNNGIVKSFGLIATNPSSLAFEMSNGEVNLFASYLYGRVYQSNGKFKANTLQVIGDTTSTLLSSVGGLVEVVNAHINNSSGDAINLDNAATLANPNILQQVWHTGNVVCNDAHTYVNSVFDISSPEEPTQNDPTGTNLHFDHASQLRIDNSQFSVQIPTDHDYTLQELLVWMDANMGGPGPLGTPTDGSYTDGLFEWTTDVAVNDAIDDVNEALSELAPPSPLSISGEDLNDSPSLSFYTGKLPTGLSGNWYQDGKSAGDTLNNIIMTNSVTLVNPRTHTDTGDYFGPGTEGLLKAYKDSSEVVNLDVGANFVEGATGPKDRPTPQPLEQWDFQGDADYTPVDAVATNGDNALEVTEDVKYNDFSLWFRMSVELSFNNLSEGYHDFQFNHVVRGSDRYTNLFKVFYNDDSSSLQWTTGQSPSLVEGTLNNANFISGVKYYGQNSTMDLTAQVENLFKKVYHPTRVASYSCDAHSGTEDLAPGTTPAVGDSFSISESITLNRSNYYDTDIRASVNAYNPCKSTLSAGTPIIGDGILFNSYGNVSTRLAEYFRDENHRLPSTFDFSTQPGSMVGNWDQTAQLNNGDALVYNQELRSAVGTDLSNKKPTQDNSVDFSSFTGDQVYFRAFYSSNSYSSATFSLPGFNVDSELGATGSGNVNIEVRLPGVDADWRDAGKAFGNGNGCQNTANSGGNTLAVTFGTDSTNASGGYIYVRITFRNTTSTIQSGFRITDWS